MVASLHYGSMKLLIAARLLGRVGLWGYHSSITRVSR